MKVNVPLFKSDRLKSNYMLAMILEKWDGGHGLVLSGSG
jgi:hypothetical protein